MSSASHNMPKKRSKSGPGAKVAPLDQSAVPADDEASVHSSQGEIAGQAIDSQSASCDDANPSHEPDSPDDASASADQSEYSAEGISAPADAFVSADEAATAAFGSEQSGNIGTKSAEAESEVDVVMRIPVDWGGEFESSFCGLKNMGNTCFLNSVGMMLAHCPGVFWHCMFDLDQKENSEEYYFQSR
jgi:hypothetical protein